MSHGVHLFKDMCPRTHEEREHIDRISYNSMIGSIMYVMLCTRPSISHALSITSRYQANHDEKHWMAIKNILKYLQRTKDMFLVYRGFELIVQGYTNYSFWSDRDNYKSQSSNMFMLNGGAVN